MCDQTTNGPIWLRPVTSSYLVIDDLSPRGGERRIANETSKYMESYFHRFSADL